MDHNTRDEDRGLTVLDGNDALAGPGGATRYDTIVTLPVTLLRTDGGTQTRARLDPSIVADYAAAMREGAQFPPLTVFYDGSEYWVADGFHRQAAAEEAERSEIAVQVCQGTRREAILYSCGANANHGLRRSNADKERAVQTLLRDEEWRQWSDSEIARRCFVDHKTVTRVRTAMEASGEIPRQTARLVTRAGTTFALDTSGISAANAERADLSPEYRARGWWLVRAEQDGHGVYWAERPGARWPAPGVADSIALLERELDALTRDEEHFDPAVDPAQRPWPLSRSADYSALTPELLARGWSLFENSATATWWMQVSPLARVRRSAWNGRATPQVTSAEEAIEDARAVESLERHGWSLQGKPGAWWASEGGWYVGSRYSTHIRQTTEYASWSAVAAAVRAQERDGKAPRTPAVRETAVLAPHVLWAGDQQGAYELPPIQRLAVRYHTAREGVITTVRCAQADDVELSRPPEQVWRLADEEAWTRAQCLYQEFQTALSALADQLIGLGTYAEALRVAGGVKKAPGRLCETVIAAEQPGRMRTIWFSRWRVPSVVRRTIVRHTAQMLEYDSSSGYGGLTNQAGHFVCPSNAAWRQVESCYRRAIAAQEAWGTFCREVRTYAQAFAQSPAAEPSSADGVSPIAGAGLGVEPEHMVADTHALLPATGHGASSDPGTQDLPFAGQELVDVSARPLVGRAAQGSHGVQGTREARPETLPTPSDRGMLQRIVEDRLAVLLACCDPGLVQASLLLLAGAEALDDLDGTAETIAASLACLLTISGLESAAVDERVRVAILVALGLSPDGSPPDVDGARHEMDRRGSSPPSDGHAGTGRDA